MRKTTVALLAAATFAIGAQAAHAQTIRVQSTTDTKDAGLVEGIADPTTGDHIKGLIELFEEANPGYTVEYTAVGTGVAIDNAIAGQGDVVITHAPTLEQQFVEDGWALGLGRQIFYSDYVIIGPNADPAGVAAAHGHDAVSAYEDIAAAGADGDATFVSRVPATGKLSGTATQEQIIWGLTDSVPKHLSTSEGATADQYSPDATSWYKASSSGQADNVKRTSLCASASFPNGNCYTMTDRGTFNNLVNDGTITNLKIVADLNDAAARGGKDLLINPFSTYVVNPDKFADPNKPDAVSAQKFVDFLVSQSFQDYLPGFPNAIDPAFRPDAFPAVSLDTPLPQTAAGGAALNVAGTLTNQLPGANKLAGATVRLQRSTDGGLTWADAGAATQTDGNGHFAIPTAIAQTAGYRLHSDAIAATPTIGGDPFTQLSAHDQPLGSVTVAGPGGGGGTNPPPQQPPAADKKKPRVTRVKLTAKRISIRVSEKSVVRVTILRRVVRKVKGKRKTTFRTVKRVTIRAKKAGTARHRIKRLKAGTYRIRITATDSAGNRRTTTVSRKLKR